MYCSLFNHLTHSRFTVVFFSFDLMQWLIVSLMCVNERNRNTCMVKHHPQTYELQTKIFQVSVLLGCHCKENLLITSSGGTEVE
jgi:hypothetical protein